jgi:hypothetical protein
VFPTRAPERRRWRSSVENPERRALTHSSVDSSCVDAGGDSHYGPRHSPSRSTFVGAAPEVYPRHTVSRMLRRLLGSRRLFRDPQARGEKRGYSSMNSDRWPQQHSTRAARQAHVGEIQRGGRAVGQHGESRRARPAGQSQGDGAQAPLPPSRTRRPSPPGPSRRLARAGVSLPMSASAASPPRSDSSHPLAPTRRGGCEPHLLSELLVVAVRDVDLDLAGRNAENDVAGVARPAGQRLHVDPERHLVGGGA